MLFLIGCFLTIPLLTVRSNNKMAVEDKLPETELLGQMNVFVFAGTDTTSTAMSRALQELSIHLDIQTRLREEVTQASKYGEMDYETLSALPILDAVCKETLRMYAFEFVLVFISKYRLI